MNIQSTRVVFAPPPPPLQRASVQRSAHRRHAHNHRQRASASKQARSRTNPGAARYGRVATVRPLCDRKSAMCRDQIIRFSCDRCIKMCVPTDRGRTDARSQRTGTGTDGVRTDGGGGETSSPATTTAATARRCEVCVCVCTNTRAMSLTVYRRAISAYVLLRMLAYAGSLRSFGKNCCTDLVCVCVCWCDDENVFPTSAENAFAYKCARTQRIGCACAHVALSLYLCLTRTGVLSVRLSSDARCVCEFCCGRAGLYIICSIFCLSKLVYGCVMINSTKQLSVLAGCRADRSTDGRFCVVNT